MLPEAAPDDDPLEQDAEEPQTDDLCLNHWFLEEAERGNASTGLRSFSTGNSVRALVDGASYFPALYDALCATEAGDQVYLLDFRGDLEERLAGPGTAVGNVLADASDRGVAVFGLLWRSQPKVFQQSEEANAAFVRHICDHDGDVLLDARTRRAGSHHQKLVLVRHPGCPSADVAFVGGIDLGFSRGDDSDHRGDDQTMEFPSAYGERPSWHDVQVEVRRVARAGREMTERP